MNKTRIPVYSELLNTHTEQLSEVSKKHTRIALMRLAVFIAFALSWTWLFINFQTLGAILGASLVIVFLVLLKKHKKLEEQRNYLEAIITINQHERHCCEGDFSHFDPGNELSDINHPYAYDIDLFGIGSLFQYLNRTITFSGKQKLANWLKNTPLQNQGITKNQESINELSDKLTFRQKFLTIGNLYPSKADEQEEIKQWLNFPSFFKKPALINILLVIIPLINLGVLVAGIMGYCSYTLLIVTFLGTLFIVGSRIRNFNQHYYAVSNSHNLLKKLLFLLQLIEQTQVKSKGLNNYKNSLKDKELQASKQIQQLSKLLSALDNRNNIIMGVILNGFFLWDWQYLIRIEKWKKNHQVKFDQWIDCIAYYDAIISLANLQYNNPDFTFPELNTTDFELTASEIGHPLLNNEVRICNNFTLDPTQRYAIVTGANMAGKSTFLRTIAVNLILAGTGSTVCAKKMTFHPLPMFSSMRAEDSLMKNESYFFAELKRLQRITQELDKGKKLFIILDEILRGTNSEDKRKGSIGFVKKITKKMAHGLVATHDLELARLAEQQPDTFKALCFEVAIKNNELQFDYKLQPGVTQNMNASFLMHQMGIIDD